MQPGRDAGIAKHVEVSDVVSINKAINKDFQIAICYSDSGTM